MICHYQPTNEFGRNGKPVWRCANAIGQLRCTHKVAADAPSTNQICMLVKADCARRGEQIGTVACESCGGNEKIHAVFACDIHRACIVRNIENTQSVNGVLPVICDACADYRPK